MSEINPYGPQIVGQQMAGPAMAMQRLATYRFATAAASTPVIDFPVRSYLMVMLSISGMTAAGFPTVQLGTTAHADNTVETGNLYWHRNMESVPSTDTFSGNFNNTGTPSTNNLVMGYSTSSVTQIILMTINNLAGANKTVSWTLTRTTTGSGVVGIITAGWGECFVTQQVNKILLSNASSTTFAVNTRITIFGKSPV